MARFSRTPFMLLAALVVLSGAAFAQKVKASVTYAKTWDAAVDEAKMLNVPIVVHSHGFF